jgi:hypothetical protein
MDDIKDANDRWRISKDIPITVVGFLLFQTLCLTWFLAGLRSDLSAVIKDTADAKAAAYTKEDARHEREFIEQKFLTMQNTTEDHVRRIAIIEGQINELRNKINK